PWPPSLRLPPSPSPSGFWWRRCPCAPCWWWRGRSSSGSTCPEKENLRGSPLRLPVSLYPPGEHLTVYLEALRLFRHVLPVEGVLCHLYKPPLVGWLLQHRAGDDASLLADLQPGGALGANVRHVIAAALPVVHPYRRAILPVRLGI